MIPVNNLLTKAVSALNNDQAAAPELVQQPPVQTSFDFLSACQLNDEEKGLLGDVIYESRLTPNLTLFDVLFFDLHEVVLSLKNCVCPDDFEKAVETLETCYAAFLQGEPNADRLKDFLKTVALNFIRSNHRKLTAELAATADQRSVLASADTKRITTTLVKRAALFKKIVETDCRLGSATLSSFVGNERLEVVEGSDQEEIFTNNSLFIQLVYNSLCRTTPELERCGFAAAPLINLLVSFGTAQHSLEILETFKILYKIFTPASPLFVKIVDECWIHYSTIIESTVKMFESRDTEAMDLNMMAGKPQSVRNFSALDPNDILAEFKCDRLVEPTFYLTPAESALLQELFNYPLDSQMTMADLLGFGMSDRLSKLISHGSPFNDKITRAQGLISTYCIMLFNGFSRETPSSIDCVGSVNKYSNNFALFRSTFPEWTKTLFDSLEQTIKKSKHKKKQSVLDRLNSTVRPLERLFNKLLTSPGCFELLYRSAATYRGGCDLDRPSPHGQAFVQKYWEYVRGGCRAGIKEGIFSIGFPFDKIAQGELPFSKPPRLREMTAFGSNLAHHISQCSKNTEEMKRELVLAAAGKITYQSWLKAKGIRSTLQKNKNEFLEQLHSNLLVGRTIFIFLADMLRLTEFRFFPTTVTTRSCSIRLRYNMHKTTLPVDYKPSAKFDKILNPIESELGKHSDLYEFAFNDPDTKLGVFDHAKWLEFLVPIEPSITPVLESSLRALTSLKEELVQDLEKEWSALSFEELQRVDVAATKESIFQEGLRLLRPLLVLSDMLAILQKRRYSEEAAIIPRELADVMELDGLEEVLQRVIQAKTPQVVAQPPQPIKAVEQKAAAVKKATVKIAAAVPITAPTPAPESELDDLADLKKSREILKRLKALDFFEVRQTGSHHILEGPEGGMVVVPNNDNLPLGTRKSIARQAADALGK